ncbi:MAG: DUF2795 domain-containing protein [Armatimonadota bacterium]
MAGHENLNVPHAPMPRYLDGLPLPATTVDALAYAEERGAPPEMLELIEALPAAVFTSEEGIRHAFSTLDPDHLPHPDSEHVLVGKDGTSS